MSEPGKWELSPLATLREMARSEADPGYQGTICGVHRTLWLIINVDLNGYIPQEELDEINLLLELAFKMGKRMDHRLHQYYYLVEGKEVPNPLALTKLHTEEVLFQAKELAELKKGKTK